MRDRLGLWYTMRSESVQNGAYEAMKEAGRNQEETGTELNRVQ